jgi:BirA family biotin operon repressor/biotin-[acetyl-CoA-carboxylase] ligase
MDAVPERNAGDGLWARDLLVFEALPSTQDWALRHAAELEHGDVIRAMRQQAGRGRLDRTWVSPGRCCVTFSAVVREPGSQAFPKPLVLPVAALSVRQALREFKVPARLKWPNDVLVGDRKIAGILADSVPDGRGLVLGVGVNVNITGPALEALRFPQPPTSMAVERERLFDVDLVFRRLLVSLEKQLDLAWQGGPALVSRRWNEADDFKGRRVVLKTETGAVEGTYEGMAEDGRLVLADPAGARKHFWTGDVTLLRPAAPAAKA